MLIATSGSFTKSELSKNEPSRSMRSIVLHLMCCLVMACPLCGDDATESRPIILMLLGAPGSGRDVIAVRISSTYSLPHISTADLLLDYSEEESETGRITRDCLNNGNIPDELLLRIITDRVRRTDCLGGFLLDGFPKTPEQAKALKSQLGVKYRLLPTYIRTSDEWLANFHEGRLVCTNCGRVYHLDRSPPQNEERCDLCGYELTQRNDDAPEYRKKLFENYRAKIVPLLTFYSQEGLLVEIDGNRPLDEMYQDVRVLLSAQHLSSKIP